MRTLEQKLEQQALAYQSASKDLTTSHQTKVTKEQYARFDSLRLQSVSVFVLQEAAWAKEMSSLEQRLESLSLQLARVSEEKLELLRECSHSQNKFTEEIKKLENETIRSLNERIAESTARLAAHVEQLEAAREEIVRVLECFLTICRFFSDTIRFLAQTPRVEWQPRGICYSKELRGGSARDARC